MLISNNYWQIFLLSICFSLASFYILFLILNSHPSLIFFSVLPPTDCHPSISLFLYLSSCHTPCLCSPPSAVSSSPNPTLSHNSKLVILHFLSWTHTHLRTKGHRHTHAQVTEYAFALTKKYKCSNIFVWSETKIAFFSQIVLYRECFILQEVQCPYIQKPKWFNTRIDRE